MVAHEEGAKAQIDRILQSETLRSSDVLRHLLRFLAEKSFSDDAGPLKEYTIGLDALGKPPTYDPRHDASVRLQAGRLRQKLTEYYFTEGKSDPVVFELPKGHFKLIWRTRIPADTANRVVRATAPIVNDRHRSTVILLCSALLIALALSAYSTTQLWRVLRNSLSPMSPELRELWQPFIDTSRPTIIALADPFFVGLAGEDGADAFYFRDRSVERWEDAGRSSNVAAIQKLFKSQRIVPNQDFALRGDMMCLFLIAKLLGARQPNLSAFRLSTVSADDLSHNNALLIGSQHRLDGKLLDLPLKPELVAEAGGVRNLHPRPGEPAFLREKSATSTEGEVFALVSLLPGPLGNTIVESITGTRTWARMGASQFLTDPQLARVLTEKLRTPSGSLPRYYQVVLRVIYRDGIVTEVSYVMHRDLSSSFPSPRRG